LNGGATCELEVAVLSSNSPKPTIFQQVWRILSRQERRGLGWIFVLMIVGSVLETLSLGLVVPVVGLLTRPNYIQNFPRINELLGYPTEHQFVIGMMFALVVVYIAKSFFLIWSAWVQRGYSASVTTRIGRQLFRSYLYQPYAFHLQRNSAVLIRNSQNSGLVMTGIIDPILVISSDILVTAGLLVLLIKLEPIGSIATISIFGLTSWIFRKFTNSRIKTWGEIQNFHKRMLLQHLQQGFGGVKDVKILGTEEYFASQYGENLLKNSEVVRRFSIAQTLPRFGLEILTIIGLAVLVSTMVLLDSELPEILPVLGLFGAAAFRLLPAVNRLISNFQIINVSRPQVNEVFEDLDLPDQLNHKNSDRSTLTSAISIVDISFSYAESLKNVVSGVSVKIGRGEAVGLIGSSGSGKSTLVDILLGLLEPNSGKVLVDGSDIHDDLRGWQDQIGYVPQSIFLTDDTLRRNVAFGLPKDKIDDDAVRSAIRSAQLEEFVASLPDGMETVVGERGVRLSGGQRQRIGIARALYNNPDVLVLDEATSSLDTETEHGVMQAVQALQGDKTVIIVAHRLSTVEYCDRLYRLENAQIVDEGTFSEVTSRTKDLPRDADQK
jgi:ABC-type multidrug transport system fused ATPase/permease subunit